MTAFEVLYLLTTLLALVVSTVALDRTRRLNRVVAELAAKQLELINRAERATVVAELVREGPTTYAFHLSNRSDVMAYDVNFELLDCPASPLISGDYNQKIPAPSIAPRGQVRLATGMHQESPPTYRARVAWRNPDQTTGSQEFFLSR